MAVAEIIYFRLQTQPTTRLWFLARIHPEPACGAPSPSWTLTCTYPASMSPNQLLLVRLHSLQTNAPLQNGV